MTQLAMPQTNYGTRAWKVDIATEYGIVGHVDHSQYLLNFCLAVAINPKP